MQSTSFDFSKNFQQQEQNNPSSESDTNNSINIYVTGEAGKTIRWTALVTTVEVAQ